MKGKEEEEEERMDLRATGKRTWLDVKPKHAESEFPSVLRPLGRHI